jgi:hypothetical protein
MPAPRETEATAGLDNKGLLVLQQQMMKQQVRAPASARLAACGGPLGRPRISHIAQPWLARVLLVWQDEELLVMEKAVQNTKVCQ